MFIIPLELSLYPVITAIVQQGCLYISTYRPLSLESGLINDNANVTFNFAPGKTYRLHLINMSGFATFYYSIDGHQMEIIEVDGVSYFN